MNVAFQVYGSLCEMQNFVINGVDADKYDFGTHGDRSPETAEDYACGDMQFIRQGSTPDVLAKYGITQAEYDEIAAKLEDGLSFGSCGWCV